MNEKKVIEESSALQSVRDPSAPAILTAQPQNAAAVSVAFREEQQELILREAANLESELCSLNLRLCRMRPDMDTCGEALC